MMQITAKAALPTGSDRRADLHRPADGMRIPSAVIFAAFLAIAISGCVQDSATIERIIDGDTLIADGNSVRLALVDAPEYNEKGGLEATVFLESLCPIGSSAIIDVDNGQPSDSYGRTIAVVSCNGKNANREMLESNLTKIYRLFCEKSEFGDEGWAIKEGC